MNGLPELALDTLVRMLARICDDPYNRLFSKSLGADPRERMAELAESGFIEFAIDDVGGLLHVHRLVWTG